MFNKFKLLAKFSDTQFHNYTVYRNLHDFNRLKHHFLIRYSGLILLSATTAITANYNLFLATIPGVLTGIQIASVVGKRYYLKQFVTQIDLDEKLENMKIKFADGTSLDAPVKTNNLIEIKDIFEQSKDKIQQDINEQYSKSNYVVIFKNSMLPGTYRLMVSQDISIIDNTKLFKDVISGSDLKQYEYKVISQTNQSKTETEEEIENTQDQYDKRKQALKDLILSTDADVIALQEVAESQIDFLGGDYQKFLAPIQILSPSEDPDYRSEGNLILVKPHIQVKEYRFFHISIFRNFQVIQINNLLIVNTHLHHVIEEHQIRAHQIYNILVYLNKFPNQEIVLLGDLNLFPNSEEYQTLSKHFKSSYLKVHGKEPDSTFPTGLTGPYMDTDPGGTLDYIWLRGNIEPISIKIIGDQKIEEGVYPSDHMGLVGEFKL